MTKKTNDYGPASVGLFLCPVKLFLKNSFKKVCTKENRAYLCRAKGHKSNHIFIP